MSTQVTPMWKMRINDCLRRSNKVNLSGEDIDSLEKIGTIKLMVQLDLSYVRTIHSFEGFKHQPALKTLIADGSAISSLKNISSLSNITAISIKNTPLLKSNQKFNVLASLILSIPNLRIFNGKVISQKTRAKIESAGYPMPQTAELINAGWIVEYPCPSKGEIIELLKYYGIYNENDLLEEEEEVNEKIEEEEDEADENDIDENEKDNIASHDQSDENNDSNNNKSLDHSIQNDNDNNNNENTEGIQNEKSIQPEQNESSNEYEYYENTDEMESTNEKNENENEYENGNINDNDNPDSHNINSDEFLNFFNKPIHEMSLLEKVVMVLRTNGYHVDPNNMQQSVLNTIDALCSEVEQMNSTISSEQASQT